MTTPDMDVSWARVIFAVAVVAALIALMGFVLKHLQMRGLAMPAPGVRRLQVVEQMPLDARRRLVIVRCDDKEHLLLLGANEDIVVAANLEQHAVEMRTKIGS
jgi:flagellar protein FliO/FliZ